VTKIFVTARVVVALALACGQPIKAQTRDQLCQATGGGSSPVQQVACAAQTPELRNILDENMQLAAQIASRLDPAGLQQWKATNLERQRAAGISCGIAPDRAPQLPASPATESCLAGQARTVNGEWRKWLAANGSAPVRNPQFGNVGRPAAPTQAASPAQTQANADCLRYRYGILAGLHSNEQCTYPPEAFVPRPPPPCIGNPNPAIAALAGCVPQQPQPRQCFYGGVNTGGVVGGTVTCY
jgi:hypothetical protein